MKLILKKICIGLAWTYSATVVLWWGLHIWFGDSVWWLALLNSFVPYLFLPILFLLPACIFCRWQSFWTSIIFPALIFVGLYGFLFLPNWSVSFTEAATTPLSIMTFNIWGGSQSQETAQVILDNKSPDIVAIQELTPPMEDVLLEKVGEAYPYRILDAQAQHRGMGVLSRCPLTEMDSSHLADPAWQIQIIQVEAEFGEFTLYNVHPLGTNIFIYLEEELPVGDNVQASFQVRKQLIEVLITDIRQRQGPVVVAGDFNSTDQSEVYELLQSILKDSHRTAGWGLGHTFPAYAGSFRGVPIFSRQMRIDMIFYSLEFTALSSRVGTTYGESDHLPVIVQLVWQK
jgi:endonuclease/exonuclease/phosphatase (EEP) superfamily protein YafD